MGELRIWFGIWLAAMLVLVAIPVQPGAAGSPLAGSCLEGEPVLTNWDPQLEAEFQPGCQGGRLRLFVRAGEEVRPVEEPADFDQWAFLRLNTRVVVNPYKDAYPFVSEATGQPMIPLRVVTEALGGEVKWEEEIQQVTAHWRGRRLRLTVGEPFATLNERTVLLRQAPVLWLDRTMVSPDLLAEAFGVRVTWDQARSQLAIRAAGVLCPETFCVKA